MSDILSTKKYPVSTSEVSKMLGLESSEHGLPMGSFGDGHGAPHGLPVHEEVHGHADTEGHAEDHAAAAADVSSHFLISSAKAAGPYIAVFAVGVFLYFFFFSSLDLNFSSLFNKANTQISGTQETALQNLEKQDSANYQKWISGFYYDVTDSKILDPDADNSHNGLTNFEKYLLDLNPKEYDTLGLGMADSQALAAGINPNTGTALTNSQKSVLDKYVDMEVAMNRLALYNMQNPSQVAGASINSSGTVVSNNPQVVTPVYNTSTLYSNLDINTNIPGRLEIPSLNINVPIIWSTGAENFEKDLQSGVIHYPGTAMPGQIGTTYIAGHSSNYVWAKGNYNQVFSKLGDLADNASFKVTVVQKNGKDAILHYVVSGRGQYTPTDPAQFQNGGKSVVELSTCWPVGSTAKRLVVYGELTQVEQ